MDMQGFAINVRLLLKRSDVWIEGGGAYTDMGYVEASRFIFQFVSNTSMLECRTQMNEVLWVNTLVFDLHCMWMCGLHLGMCDHQYASVLCT